MKAKRSILVLVLISMVAIMLFNCGGKQVVKEEGDIPEWFTNPPQDPNYLFATATHTSRSLQIARDQAATTARGEIGRQTEVRIQALQKSFSEEVGFGEDAELLQQFTTATKTVVSTSLSGSRISQTKTKQDGNLWTAFVLVEYPIGAANQALMEQIKKSNQMYTRFRSSETFKELEDEVKKYEEFKKNEMR